ncbi:MAG: imidazoleglycerol-phosphate dehydratase [Candidatus Nitrosotalea sp.]|nr:imidazoleglycerol-phosphate dehydratase [Candidatus Nitrosotalea sp.]
MKTKNGITNFDTGIKYLDHIIMNFCEYTSLEVKINQVPKNKTSRSIISYTTELLSKAMSLSITNTSIVGFGYASIPSDESLAKVSLDLKNSQYCKVELGMKGCQIDDLQKEDLEYFFHLLSKNLKACLHITVEYGIYDKHKVDAVVKALAMAWRQATNRYEKK